MSTTTEPILNAEQQEVIDQLRALQDKKAKSDGAFARDHLTYSASAWNRIKSGDYFTKVKDPEAVVISLSKSLRLIQMEEERLEKFSGRQFIKLPDAKAVLKAIAECRQKPQSDPDRIVVYLAPTGGGKSALGGYMVSHFGASLAEAREAWKKSYFTALKDVGTSVGLDMSEIYNPTDGENLLLPFLRKRKHILVFDEGEYFGLEALNLIKLIMNTTPTTLLINAIGRAYRKWNHYYPHEASQILRRTHAVIEFSGIQPADALQFLRCKVDDAGVCGKLLADAANSFGAYDFLVRTATELGEDEASVNEVRAAIRRVEGFMGLDKLKKG
jgi:hypothetical protein